jgi:tRNA-dihydrouridine synthase 4
MIMANSFVRSSKARDIEFTTHAYDRPLIVQFAANNANELATAAQFVRIHCDGIELNCGCPQRWAIQEGVGSALIENNALLCEMIKETRRRLDHPADFTVAAKIRLHTDIKYYRSLKFGIFQFHF